MSVFPTLKIILMMVLFWLALASWALVSPVGASPDEDFHQTMIYCAASPDSTLCRQDGKRSGVCYPMSPNVSGSCSNDAALERPAGTQIDLLSTLPIYYKTISLFIGKNLGETTLNIRLFNVTLALVLAFFSIYLSLPTLRRAVAISWLVVSVPVGNYFIASVNSSSWAIISIAALWGPVLSIFLYHKLALKPHFQQFKFYSFRVIFILLLCLIGLGSRHEAYIFIPLVFSVMFLYWFSNLKLNKLKLIKISIYLLIAVFLSYLFIINIDQPFVKAEGHLRTSLFKVIANYFSNPEWRTLQLSINSLLGTFALTGVPGAELGTHDVPTPAIASFFITLAFAGSFLLGMGSIDRPKIISFSCASLLLFLIISLLWSAATWDIHQSRYFIPMIYVILGLALLPNVGEVFFYNKVQWFIIFISNAIANSLMLLSTEIRFVFGVVYQKTRYPLNLESPDLNPWKLFFVDAPNWWLAHAMIKPIFLWVFGSLAYLFAVLLLWHWVVQPKKNTLKSAHQVYALGKF